MKALLVASGIAPGRALFLRSAREADMTIAIDGGLRVFRDYGLVPDLIGDMDSVEAELLKSYREKRLSCSTGRKKNETDAALAVDEAIGAERKNSAPWSDGWTNRPFAFQPDAAEICAGERNRTHARG